jgi:hypothetical protein
VPAAKGAVELTAPFEFTVIVGEPVLWVKVTVPLAPVVPMVPLNEVLVFVDPLVPVTVIVPPVTVRVKVQLPLSPKVSETVPVAV